MKTKILFTLLSFSIVSIAFVADVIEKIGTTQETAQSHILNNLIGNFKHTPVNTDVEGYYEGLENYDAGFKIPRLSLSAIAGGDKSAIARELCAYVKEYVHSREFTAAYQQARASARPTEEPFRMSAAQVAEMKKNLKESETAIAKNRKMMSADMIEKMEEGLASLRKTIAEQSDATPNNTQWRKLYPENPADAVKNRLQEYLKLAATVDFNAELSGTGENKKFVNPVYEKKPLKWKAIYRAGKEVNNVVTAFVKEWLKEGIKLNSVSMPATSSSENNSKNNDDDPDAAPEEKPMKGLFNKLKDKAKPVIR